MSRFLLWVIDVAHSTVIIFLLNDYDVDTIAIFSSFSNWCNTFNFSSILIVVGWSFQLLSYSFSKETSPSFRTLSVLRYFW